MKQAKTIELTSEQEKEAWLALFDEAKAEGGDEMDWDEFIRQLDSP